MDFNLLQQAVADLEDEKVVDLLSEFMAGDPSEEEAHKAVGACQDGMAVVGELFEKDEYFVGDLIFAGDLLTRAIDILKPALGKMQESHVGTIVLGTVAGDLHDIGKNIFKAMVEIPGFEVHDIGIDQPASVFVDKVKEVNPEIVGMSGLLTLAADSMEETMDALRKAGVRDGVKVIIGGNVATKETCERIGADAYTTNAAEGVKLCQEWVR